MGSGEVAAGVCINTGLLRKAGADEQMKSSGTAWEEFKGRPQLCKCEELALEANKPILVLCIPAAIY